MAEENQFEEMFRRMEEPRYNPLRKGTMLDQHGNVLMVIGGERQDVQSTHIENGVKYITVKNYGGTGVNVTMVANPLFDDPK